jgi:hypothetical protein
MDNPLILIDPLPRTLDSICDSETRCRLERLGRLIISEDRAMPAEMVDRHLPETVLLLGQIDMPRERIDRAPRLKAIFNVETNFLPNIDYVACRDHGVWVLSPTSAFAKAVTARTALDDRGSMFGRSKERYLHGLRGRAALGFRLRRSVRSITPPLRCFSNRILAGSFISLAGMTKRLRPLSSGVAVMKGFAGDPNVTPYVDDIYAYLQARADGALGRGRPIRLDE